VNGTPVKDPADFFAAGGSAEQLQKLTDNAPEWEKLPKNTQRDAGVVAKWFAQQYPKLPEEFGAAVLEEPDKYGRMVVCDICQPFIAATVSEQGAPDAPTVYISAENRFWTYSLSQGVYIETREPVLIARFSKLLLEASRACDGAVTKKLEFGFRDAGNLVGCVKHAQALLAKPSDYFDSGPTEFIPCDNGMLH
jgi:hypothetical protein